MRILYLFPASLYATKMSRGRIWYGEAVAAHRDVELRWWGEGWPGYKSNRTLGWNIARYGWDPDRAWVYQAERLLNVKDCTVPKVCCYNESWPAIPSRAFNEVQMAGVKLVVHHHANDKMCFDGFTGKLVHIPHGAPDLFCSSKPIAERSVDCLSHGVYSPEIYPTRARLARLVAHGEVPGRILKHPGYRLAHKAACDAQAANYAAALGDAKLSLCCTSKYRYLLAKIIESMRAGCVVVTDAPDDPAYHEFIRPHVIEVGRDWSDDQLADTINRALAEPERLQAMSDSARAVADQHFTAKRYAERFVDAVANML